MWKLTLLLCGTMFLVLLIGGEDRGQLRPGLARAEAEKALGPVSDAPAVEPAPILVTAEDRAPTAEPAPVPAPPPPPPQPPEVVPEPAESVAEAPTVEASPPEQAAEPLPEPAIPFSVGPQPAPEAETVLLAPEPAAEAAAVPDANAAPDAAGGQILYVSANSVNVRQDPSTDAAIVGRLPRGEPATVLWEEGPDWLRVEALNSGLEGYVARRFLSPDQP